MKRFKILFLAVLMGIFMLAQPASAQSVLEKYFPWFFPKDDGPRPEETLQAPFADSMPSENVDLDALGQNAIPLDQPHRNDSEIMEWVTTILSEALSLKAATYKNEIENLSGHFSESGLKQYRGFLSSSKLLSIMEGGQFNVNSFALEPPQLLNTGSIEGFYRWYYVTPIMLSYIKRDGSSTDDSTVSQRIKVEVQVVRSPNASGKTGVVIELWKAEAEKLQKL